MEKLKSTLIVGLKDKNSKRQEIDTLDAYKIARNIAAPLFERITITEGHSIYRHDDGSPVIEVLLIIEIFAVEKEQVKQYAELLKVALNQENITAQFERVDSDNGRTA